MQKVEYVEADVTSSRERTQQNQKDVPRLLLVKELHEHLREKQMLILSAIFLWSLLEMTSK